MHNKLPSVNRFFAQYLVLLNLDVRVLVETGAPSSGSVALVRVFGCERFLVLPEIIFGKEVESSTGALPVDSAPPAERRWRLGATGRHSRRQDGPTAPMLRKLARLNSQLSDNSIRSIA